MKTKTRLAALLLALCLTLSLSAPALAAETAAVIRLTKTTGTVEISKSSGKSISLLSNMRLYNGYHVETAEDSYAWLNLDDSKLLKEDASSEVEVRKDGKKLEVQVSSGNVFFDVAEPLEDDESLNIRTSTMVVGIRGTSGWLHVEDRWTTRISVLEGTVKCSVTDPVTGQLKSEEIPGGETALCVVYPQDRTGDKCDILREKYTVDEIPGFVLTDLTRDIPLCDKIEAETGLDIPRDLAAVAGGDPSGRMPDGNTATPEVLGEADRREDEDEEELRKKLEDLEKEEGKQENHADSISPDKALSKNPAPPSGDKDSGGSSDRDSGGGSGGGGTTTPTPPQSYGMKLTDVQVQALLDAGSSVSIQPNTDASDTAQKKNTLEVDTGLTVASGKTLDLQSGIDLEVYQGKTLQVDGTLTADALLNNGTTVVTSGNTLRLRGDLTTAGTMDVTATGRVVVDGTFTRSGTLTLANGATVLAKTFAPGAAPEGWEVSAAADANGYYSLIPTGPVTPPEPEIYTITFNADGGLVDGANTAVYQTDESGNLASWPEDPFYGDLSYEPEMDPYGGKRTDSNELTFLGWYDADGNLYQEGGAFRADTVLTARWNGWFIDSGTKTLVVSESPVMETYHYISFPVGGGDFAEYSDAPWGFEAAWGTPETLKIKGNPTSIGENAFYQASCSNIEIPDSVTSIGAHAFQANGNLQSVTIPEGVASIGQFTFGGCTSLTGLTIPESVQTIGDNAFASCRSLVSLTFAENSQLTSIGNSAFYWCDSLTSVDIPSSVTGIGDDAFSGCSGLTSIKVDGANPSYASDGVALFNKDQTTLIQFPEGHSGAYPIPGSVTSIGDYAFYNCDGLISVDIPSSVTSIGNHAFNGCDNLTSVEIPEGVTSIGDYAFVNCNGLTSVTILSSVTSIGNSAFDSCRSLTSVTIPEGVTSIGDSAFRYSGLTSVDIPDSVISIGDYAFERCSLTSVDIPSSVTSIGQCTLRGCASLTSMTISKNVTSVGGGIIQFCYALKEIHFDGTADDWAAFKPKIFSPSYMPSKVDVYDPDGNLIETVSS